jgi:predicted RNA binding protein YcfA (HicA-like mRNA interferase family)
LPQLRMRQLESFDNHTSIIHHLFEKAYASVLLPQYAQMNKVRSRFIHFLTEFPNKIPAHETIASPAPHIHFNEMFCAKITAFEIQYSQRLNRCAQIMKLPQIPETFLTLASGSTDAFWVNLIRSSGIPIDTAPALLVEMKQELVELQKEMIHALKTQLDKLPNGLTQEEAASLIEHINHVTFRQSQFLITLVTIFEDLDSIQNQEIVLDSKLFPIELANLVELEGLTELVESYVHKPQEAQPLVLPLNDLAAVKVKKKKPKPNQVKKFKEEKRIRDLAKRHQLIQRLKAEGFYKAGRKEGHANPSHDIYVHEGDEQSIIAVPRHDQISKGVLRTIEDQVKAAKAS